MTKPGCTICDLAIKTFKDAGIPLDNIEINHPGLEGKQDNAN